MRGGARSSPILAAAPRRPPSCAGLRRPVPECRGPAARGPHPGRCAWSAIRLSATAWRRSASFDGCASGDADSRSGAGRRACRGGARAACARANRATEGWFHMPGFRIVNRLASDPDRVERRTRPGPARAAGGDPAQVFLRRRRLRALRRDLRAAGVLPDADRTGDLCAASCRDRSGRRPRRAAGRPRRRRLCQGAVVAAVHRAVALPCRRHRAGRHRGGAGDHGAGLPRRGDGRRRDRLRARPGPRRRPRRPTFPPRSSTRARRSATSTPLPRTISSPPFGAIALRTPPAAC